MGPRKLNMPLNCHYEYHFWDIGISIIKIVVANAYIKIKRSRYHRIFIMEIPIPESLY